MRTRPGEQVAFRNHPDVLWIEKETQRIAIAKLRFRLKSISIFVGLDKALAGTSRTQLTFALCTFRKPTDICPRCPDLTESGRDEQHRNWFREKNMQPSGRVLFGKMDEVVFGKPAAEAIAAQAERLFFAVCRIKSLNRRLMSAKR